MEKNHQFYKILIKTIHNIRILGIKNLHVRINGESIDIYNACCRNQLCLLTYMYIIIIFKSNKTWTCKKKYDNHILQVVISI